MALSKIRSDSLEDTAIHGNRNLVINGAMQVAQRGTSFSSITANVYPVDRFFVRDVNSAAGEATVSQSTTTPDDFKNSLKIDVTTADTSLVAADQYKIEYRAEGQDVAHLNWGTSAAKAVTLSFWIRSNKTGNTQVAVLNSDNNRSYVATFSISAADTWERKELTIDGDTSGTWLTTNGIGLRLRWGSFGSTYQTSSVNQWVGSQVMSRDDSPINFFDSTDNELYLTGVQLEVGEQATPFEHRSFGDELARCQRYYEHTYPYGTAPGTANGGIGADHRYVGRETASNYGYYTAHYRVEKRAAATVTVYSYVGTANQIANGDTGGDSGAVGVIQSGTTSFLPRNTSGSGVSARALMYHFKADAEL
jgi:hypothetical protein